MRFSYKEQLFKVNKLFIIWLFVPSLQARNWPMGIAGNTLQLANQRTRYIGYEQKPYKNLYLLHVSLVNITMHLHFEADS